jgi:hypothetical protein
LSAHFGAGFVSGSFDQNRPHGLSRGGEEVAAAVSGSELVHDIADPGLAHDGSPEGFQPARFFLELPELSSISCQVQAVILDLQQVFF